MTNSKTDQTISEDRTRAAALTVGIMVFSIFTACPAAEMIYSTYLGGSDSDRIGGDSVVDGGGNYLAASDTRSPDFPVTPGAFDTTFNDASGRKDGFVVKAAPDGALLWSTFIGGPTRDNLYAIRVDKQGYVYVAGAAGPGAPTTEGVLQPDFAGGVDLGADGTQKRDGYVAKIEPDGSGIVWATYVGTSGNEGIRGMDIDAAGNVYLATGYGGSSWLHSWFKRDSKLPPEWFEGAFQARPQGGTDSVIIKLNPTGTKVIWATYLGGSGNDGVSPNVTVDAEEHVYVLTETSSMDIPTTPNAYDQSHNGGRDIFVTKLSPDGRRMLFGTYLGSAADDGASGKRGIALNSRGDAIIGGWTKSSEFPTTPDAYRSTPLEFSPWGSTGVTVKFSKHGELLASTYLGSSEGVVVDSSDNVYVSGSTALRDFPVTEDAYQKRLKGKTDAFIVKFSPDLERLLYASYIGGSGEDEGRSVAVDGEGSFYVSGTTTSSDWPLLKAFQQAYKGNTDAFITKFRLR